VRPFYIRTKFRSERVSIHRFAGDRYVLKSNQSSVNVPEIAFGVNEFNSDFILTPKAAAYKDDATFALFFRDTIDEQKRLAGFYFYAQ